MKKIMIVEDNKKIRQELAIFLTKNGYTCEAPDEFDAIVDLVILNKPHLVLLDINLPIYDGFFICKEIRKRSDVPIIIVTSRNSEIDELTALNLGADDFVTKPYNTQILLAHISSVLKRIYKDGTIDKLEYRNFEVVLSKSTIEYDGNKIELTKNELKIMTYLIQKKGTIVNRDELMKELWDSEMFVDDNTLTVNMNRLRKKLEEIGLHQVIETRRGQGYILESTTTTLKG